MENKEKTEKRNTIKGFILGVLAVLAVFCLYYLITAFAMPANTPSSMAAIEKIREIEARIDREYMGDVDKQQITDYMYYGLVAGLGDRYSEYYTKEEYEDVSEKRSGEFEGIGIVLTTDPETGKLMAGEVYEGAPADRAGMMPGDLIIVINGTDVSGYQAADAVELIKGSDQGIVNITVLRGEEKFEFTMKLEPVLLDPVKCEMLEDNIGYIKLSTFNSMTPDQYAECLEELKSKGAKGIITDLRGNLGGLLNSACDSLRKIMPAGVLVYTEDKYGKREEQTCDGEHELDLPMVLLVDSMTASSAEIFAGAVRDYNKATIIGVQTFGKGIVQNSFELSDGSVVKLTIAHYYTPNGNDIHGQGITPDVVIEGEEEQLKKAVEVLKQNR